MDHLSHPGEVLVDLDFGLSDSLLAQVNRIRQEPAALLDSLRIAAFLEFDSFGFEKLAYVIEEFVFYDWFHNWSR